MQLNVINTTTKDSKSSTLYNAKSKSLFIYLNGFFFPRILSNLSLPADEDP